MDALLGKADAHHDSAKKLEGSSGHTYGWMGKNGEVSQTPDRAFGAVR
jgi:hypothetical protein